MSNTIYRGFDIVVKENGAFSVEHKGVWILYAPSLEAAQNEVDRIKKLVANGEEIKPLM